MGPWPSVTRRSASPTPVLRSGVATGCEDLLAPPRRAVDPAGIREGRRLGCKPLGALAWAWASVGSRSRGPHGCHPELEVAGAALGGALRRRCPRIVLNRAAPGGCGCDGRCQPRLRHAALTPEAKAGLLSHRLLGLLPQRCCGPERAARQDASGGCGAAAGPSAGPPDGRAPAAWPGLGGPPSHGGARPRGRRPKPKRRRRRVGPRRRTVPGRSRLQPPEDPACRQM